MSDRLMAIAYNEAAALVINKAGAIDLDECLSESEDDEVRRIMREVVGEVLKTTANALLYRIRHGRLPPYRRLTKKVKGQ